jgi:membrane protease YdiL (CAAX protease family)
VNRVTRLFRQRPLLSFFLLAYAISWAIEMPALVAHLARGQNSADGVFLRILGSFGPALAALILIGATEGQAGLRAFVRAYRPRRAPFRWFLVALYGFAVLGFSAVLLFGVADLSAVLGHLPTALVALPLFSLTSFLVLGPLGEEPGWRGFALPRLQARYSSSVASLILGCGWAVWHAPLFAFSDWRGDLSLDTFLVLYPFYILPLTIFFTWVYNRANGSLLISTVLHAAYNYTVFMLDQMFNLSHYDQRSMLTVMGVLFWILASILLLIEGPSLGMREATRSSRV